MNLQLYLAFLIAAAILILIPGPTVALVTSTSMRRGKQAGLLAVAGSTLAAALQLVVVVGGFASVMIFASDAFEWIRWAGVAYLAYLGIRAWLASFGPVTAMAAPVDSSSALHHFTRGFVVTLTNPKTLLFLGAFLPQFVDPSLPRLLQLYVLAASFLLVAATLDSLWALVAARVGIGLSSASARPLLERISGTLLICAGAALAAVRRSG